MPPTLQDDPHVIDRATRLFRYLSDVTELRSRVVRDVADYEEHLWFSGIAAVAGADVPGLSRLDWSGPWLTLDRPPRAEPMPAPPSAFAAAVGDLASDPAWTPPDRPLAHGSADGDAFEPDEPGPALAAAWRDWTAEWRAWAEAERPRRAWQHAYTRLFALHNRHLRMGEREELVVGSGLLSWNTPSGQAVRRHLLAAPVELRFDEATGAIGLYPAGAGQPARLEDDMVELGERPAPRRGLEIEALLAEVAGAEDGLPGMREVLRQWVEAAHPEGAFVEDRGPPPPGDAPVVTLSLALILRRRGDRTLVRLFGTIIDALDAGQPVPAGVRRLVTGEDDAPVTDVPGDGRDRDRERDRSAWDDELYFPLPANDEQRQIAERLRDRQGVLVQGPPGTGKSHTIANLVSHLVATNQRVLITSHTARALAVLHGKLPPGIADLCVSVLGNDQAGQRQLEAVVQRISRRQEEWASGGREALEQEIDGLARTLDRLRREEARLRSDLRDARQRAAAITRPPVGGYGGSPTDVARLVAQDAERFGWLADRIDDVEAPLTRDELFDVLRLARAGTRGADLSAARVARPPLDGLPDLAAIERAVADRDEARRAWEPHAPLAEDRRLALLAELPASQRRSLAMALEPLRAALLRIERGGRPWPARAFADALSGQDAAWRDLAREMDRKLPSPGRIAALPEATGIEGRDAATVIADARELREHLENAGGFGFGPFKPEPVKRGAYLLDRARVGGLRCISPDALGQLIDVLEIHQRIERLERRWEPHEPPAAGGLAARHAALAERAATLSGALALADDLVRNAPSGIAADLPSLGLATTAGIDEVAALCAAGDAAAALGRAEARLAQQAMTVRAAPGSREWPVLEELAAAIDDASPGRCRAAWASLQAAADAAIREEKTAAAFARLQRLAPRLARDLSSVPGDPAWEGWIEAFPRAWAWARARAWVERVPDHDEEPLRLRLSALGDEIADTVGRLAAARAWRFCLSTMREEERQHLVAWLAAMVRIGRGTGKYVERHRNDARMHLEACSRAIPAWIMPIYKVVETLGPEPDQFDVVIVDEASQSGPEALFLAWIARKIVVVGDDRQISPSNVGIDRGDVFALNERHLQDIPLSAMFGLDTSLFDIASVRFGGRITLREHFRSMPEIIEFSNRHFYPATPLIPLRQFGAGRLEPVRAVHVPEGYESGKVNRPEAEAIVDRIAACVADPRYAGKTMGVIGLLGEEQPRLIESMLVERLDPREIAARRIVCGDAYAFQGDERDVIFLSMVKAPGEDGSAIPAMVGAAAERRFNVAASRARDQQWLFHSAMPEDFGSPDDLRRMLLSHCLGAHDAPGASGGGAPGGPFDSVFERDVWERLTARGYRVVPQVRVGPYRIDLVVEGTHGRLAIECDGDRWHGPERYDHDQARQRMLERCGWRFWRVSGRRFYLDPEAAMAPLWTVLDRLGIAPGMAGEHRVT